MYNCPFTNFTSNNNVQKINFGQDIKNKKSISFSQ